MIRIARFITFVFHPLVLVSPAVFFIVAVSGYSYKAAFLWAFVSLIFMLTGVLYIFWGMKKGFFSNFDVSNRKQRIYLFPFVIVMGLLFIISLAVFRGPGSLLVALFYFVFAIGILSAVNFKIKASVHVGSLTAALIGGVYFFGLSFLPLLALIPIMAWARVVERRHTVNETVVGAIMGCVLAFMGIIVVQYFL